MQSRQQALRVYCPNVYTVTIGDPMADAVYACMAHHIPNDSKMLAGLQGWVHSSFEFQIGFPNMK